MGRFPDHHRRVRRTVGDMVNNRKLAATERGINPLFGSNEKSRDRADARRQIEGLSQGDQMIALLSQINDKLAWLCDVVHVDQQQKATPES